MLTYWKGASGAQGFSQVGTYDILNNKYNKIATVTPGQRLQRRHPRVRDSPAANTALVQAYVGVKYDLTPVGGLHERQDPQQRRSGDRHQDRCGSVRVACARHRRPEGQRDRPGRKTGRAWDYLHINATKADGNSVLVSGRRTSTIYRVNRKTAKIKWRLRGDGVKPKTNDFKIGPGAQWGYQHDMERLPNGNISHVRQRSRPAQHQRPGHQRRVQHPGPEALRQGQEPQGLTGQALQL